MILVSVVVVTYNHELYIREALQSIVNQKVNFKFEVIVANDASTDGTMKIIQEFKDIFPEIFIIQNNDKNLGVLNNIVKLSSLVRGKYFATLDGDDYWFYDGKLQKQIDFLEANEHYNGVFHDATILMEDAFAEQKLFSNKKLFSQSYFYKEEIHASDIVNRLILPSSSAVFRTDKKTLDNFALFEDDFSVEWKLSCLYIRFSKFYYMNEIWSVYRNHSKGISKSKNQDFHLSHIKFLNKLLKDEFYKDYKYDLYKSIMREYGVLLNTSEKFDIKVFKKYLYYEFKKMYYYYRQLKQS